MSFSDIFPENSKILIVGPLPPPLGGVSVHIKRAFNLLSQNTKYSVEIFDTSNQKIKGKKQVLELLKIAFKQRPDVIHFHGFELKLLIPLMLLKIILGHQVFLTDHNSRLFSNCGKLKRFILKSIIPRIDKLIAVGPQTVEGYKENKVKLSNNFIIQNAFLPPPLNEEKQIISTYNQNTLDFIENHSPLLIANAFQIVFQNGTDLYGLDLCVELTARLKKKFPNIGFIFALANDSAEQEYFSQIKHKIKQLEIEENFHFISGQKELWPLFKKTDLMLRPTSSDGYGVSIAEALYFNCPAIASDVCLRPEGTVIFESRNINELEKAALKILS